MLLRPVDGMWRGCLVGPVHETICLLGGEAFTTESGLDLESGEGMLPVKAETAAIGQ